MRSNSRRFHYDKDSVVDALTRVGITEGDVVFSHIGLLNLGFCAGDPVETVLQAMKEVIGSEGSFVTPAYTYSFCKGEDFDVVKSVSSVGAFSNRMLSHYKFERSLDPIFSVVGFGPHVNALFDNLPQSSFGKDCVYERLEQCNAKICNLGLSLFYLTPIHFIEKLMAVPYRYDKQFSGNILHHYKKEAVVWEYYVRKLCAASLPDCSKLEAEGFQRNICYRASLGLGEVISVSMVDYFDLAKELVNKDPWFLAAGPPPVCHPDPS